jgi:hypothetical protein
MKRNKLKNTIATVLCFSTILAVAVIGMPKAQATTATDTTLTFTGTDGNVMGTDTVLHDGDFDSAPISGFQLDIFNSNTDELANAGTCAGRFAYFSATDIGVTGFKSGVFFAVATEDNSSQTENSPKIIVMKSNDKGGFWLKSFVASNTNGNTSLITVKGYKNENYITGSSETFNLETNGKLIELDPIYYKDVDEVRISDASGTANGAYFNDITIETTAPAVTSISPSSGSSSGGTSVAITGTNFFSAQGANVVKSVKFGNTDASSYTVNSDTQITATAPAGSAGSVDITVATTGGTSDAVSTDKFKYAASIVAPTTQSSAITFSSVTSTGMTIGMTSGNGSCRAVFVKEGTGAITNPTDGATYTASPNWSSTGTQLGTSGYYCVYNGTGNSVSLTGLSA